MYGLKPVPFKQDEVFVGNMRIVATLNARNPPVKASQAISQGLSLSPHRDCSCTTRP